MFSVVLVKAQSICFWLIFLFKKEKVFIFDFSDLDIPSYHSQYTGSSGAIDHNLYVKVDYALFNNTNLYADLQKRKVIYEKNVSANNGISSRVKNT